MNVRNSSRLIRSIPCDKHQLDVEVIKVKKQVKKAYKPIKLANRVRRKCQPAGLTSLDGAVQPDPLISGVELKLTDECWKEKLTAFNNGNEENER